MTFAQIRAIALSAALLAPVLSLPACVPPPGDVALGPNPYPPVPARLTELRPLPPVSEAQLVWRMGEWEWTGTGYVWQPGEWEPLGGHSNEFMPGHWVPQGGAWIWVRGHWL